MVPGQLVGVVIGHDYVADPRALAIWAVATRGGGRFRGHTVRTRPSAEGWLSVLLDPYGRVAVRRECSSNRKPRAEAGEPRQLAHSRQKTTWQALG